MGKAYTEQEKEELKKKIQSVSLELFRKQGRKKVSIKDITVAAGISQGGFYSFYESKEDLMVQLFALRFEQKAEYFIREILPEWEGKSPEEVLFHVLYEGILGLQENMAFNNAKSDSILFLRENEVKIGTACESSGRKLVNAVVVFFEKQGRKIQIDLHKGMNVWKAGLILLADRELMGEDFEEIMEELVKAGTRICFTQEQ